MGSTLGLPTARPAGPGNPQPKPIRNPHRDLDAWQASNGLWWLCVDGDPERIHSGPFGNRPSAIANRDWLVDSWKARHPGVDG